MENLLLELYPLAVRHLFEDFGTCSQLVPVLDNRRRISWHVLSYAAIERRAQESATTAKSHSAEVDMVFGVEE